ncbi:MAG: type II toxin-antitoxin system RelE/ParE family toxin [Mariprofundus sp.]|nr:type II toxin-antitoxin system RelE/ParE family toxin [Mariprofundus sp.]
MYRIEVTKRASKALRRMPANQRTLVMKKIKAYAEHPDEDLNVIKLVGEDGYRMRIGDWRVIFDRQDDVLLILVLEVGPRGGVYQ